MTSPATEKLSVTCPHCHHRVNTDPVGAYDVFIDEIGEPIKYSLLKCPVCEHPMLTYQWYNEMANFDGWTGSQWQEPSVQYPELYRQFGSEVPLGVRNCFGEANTCFQSKAYTACAIMCRKTLEGVGKEFMPEGRNLYGIIEQLKDNGTIDTKIYEWATALRESGNTAVHDIESNITKEDAQDILGFTEAFIDYTLVLSKRFDEFMNRRSQ